MNSHHSNRLSADTARSKFFDQKELQQYLPIFIYPRKGMIYNGCLKYHPIGMALGATAIPVAIYRSDDKFIDIMDR